MKKGIIFLTTSSTNSPWALTVKLSSFDPIEAAPNGPHGIWLFRCEGVGVVQSPVTFVLFFLQ